MMIFIANGLMGVCHHQDYKKVTQLLSIKSHNIFVANLMITDIILALVSCVVSSIMTVGHVIGRFGTGDFITCNVYKFLFHPVLVIHFTFLMISVDKTITIILPFKYRKIMTVHAVACIIAASWLKVYFDISLYIFQQ